MVGELGSSGFIQNCSFIYIPSLYENLAGCNICPLTTCELLQLALTHNKVANMSETILTELLKEQFCILNSMYSKQNFGFLGFVNTLFYKSYQSNNYGMFSHTLNTKLYIYFPNSYIHFYHLHSILFVRSFFIKFKNIMNL